MKSIKPGRGPSMMGGVMSIAIGIFGVFWTILVASMGGGFMAVFGIIFVIIAVCMAVYHFSNATRKNRFSSFDITDGDEESDPLNDRYGKVKNENMEQSTDKESSFCPYCGAKVEGDYEYCNKCGKKLP